MRRIILGLLAVTLVLSFGSMGVSAARWNCNHDTACICETTANHRGRKCYVDTDGDAVCDFSCVHKLESGHNTCGNRENFTDDNGDGICDNRKTDCGEQSRKGHGNGQGGHHRRGR